MSESVIFSVGAVVFLMTVWGSVMASGILLGRVQEAERNDEPPGDRHVDRRSPERP